MVEAPEPDNRVQEVWKGFSQGSLGRTSCTKLIIRISGRLPQFIAKPLIKVHEGVDLLSIPIL